MASEPVCPACGENRTRPLFTVAAADYVECLACGLAHMDPLPTENDLLANFSSSYFEASGVPGGYDNYAADEPLHRRNARRRLARVAKHRHGRPPGSFLDIGCAYGYALDEARTQGWSVAGVEPAPAAAERAHGLDLRVFPDTGATRAAYPDGFDVVSLCQVLSHVADPVSVVASAAKALKPGGLLFIETWRRDTVLARLAGRRWHVIIPPTVVLLETSSSIRAVLERVGLDVVGWTHGRKTVSLGHVASLLDDRGLPRLVAGAMARLSRSRWARASVFYPFADLVWVTATAERAHARSADLGGPC